MFACSFFTPNRTKKMKTVIDKLPRPENGREPTNHELYSGPAIVYVLKLNVYDHNGTLDDHTGYEFKTKEEAEQYAASLRTNVPIYIETRHIFVERRVERVDISKNEVQRRPTIEVKIDESGKNATIFINKNFCNIPQREIDTEIYAKRKEAELKGVEHFNTVYAPAEKDILD